MPVQATEARSRWSASVQPSRKRGLACRSVALFGRDGGGPARSDGALFGWSTHGRCRCRPSGRTTDGRLWAIGRTADLRQGRRTHHRKRHCKSQCSKSHVDCSVAGAWRRIAVPWWMPLIFRGPVCARKCNPWAEADWQHSWRRISSAIPGSAANERARLRDGAERPRR